MVIVFEYDDYVNFLGDWILSRPKKGRGVKSEMAHYMGCLPAHITKVLNRDVHLTLEQAAKVLSFLELTSLEGHYFLGLVELGRAGNRELQILILERLSELKKKIQDASRIGAQRLEFSTQDKDIYFSSWLYIAIEILSSISRFQTLDDICSSLKISKVQAMEVLDFLIEKNLIIREEDKFLNKEIAIKTTADPGSSNLKNHHKSWRTRAMVSLDQKFENNLNFTGVISLPKVVTPAIREILIATIKELWEMAGQHPDDPDEAFCLCIDFFNFSSVNE